MKYLNETLKNQRGQVLLFVIVTMTIALAVGVGVSLRTISSISRVARTDTSSRVLAAAEGGLERFLTKTNNELSVLANACTSSDPNTAPSQCEITFPSTVDSVDAIAVVQVLELGANDPEYTFTAKKDAVTEINLSGYDSHPAGVGVNEIKVCWKSPSGGVPTDMYYLAYSPSAMIKNGACYGGNFGCGSSSVVKTGFSLSTSELPYTSCFTIGNTAGSADLPDDIVGLRIRSLGGDADYRISVVNAGALPLQGYEIISTGLLTDVANVKTIKTIRAKRSLPYLPGMFDFGLYSDTGTID